MIAPSSPQPTARRALMAKIARPGYLALQGRKVWERVRFRLAAAGRPALTVRRHRALENRRIVVYTMGKVGSSSVYYTLMKSFPFRHVHHNHFLSEHWLTERLPGTPFTRNISLARATLADIATPGVQVLYICMMRDPIARDLSNVIQNYVENDIDLDGAPFEEVLERIRTDGHMFHQNWSETEFANYFGRPVTDFPFDHGKGFAMHELPGGDRILFLTVETMDRTFDTALAEFLGTPVDPQYVFNESSKKAEGLFYDRLKKSYRLPPEELDAIYATPTVRHFYTEERIARFKSRWSR